MIVIIKGIILILLTVASFNDLISEINIGIRITIPINPKSPKIET
jgi:hypothetical protein